MTLIPSNNKSWDWDSDHTARARPSAAVAAFLHPRRAMSWQPMLTKLAGMVRQRPHRLSNF